MKKIIALDGFKFGSFMQLAIGPLTIIILNTSIKNGYLSGLAFMGGEIVIDILYMFLACIGISKLLHKKYLQSILKYFGAVIFIYFGLNIILNIYNISILPIIRINGYYNTNLFLQGIILTASNPLSIIFFSGIFTSKIIEKNYSQSDTFVFAAGCVFARIMFLLIIIFLGSIINRYFNQKIINILNIIVGIIIVYFGIRLFIKKI